MRGRGDEGRKEGEGEEGEGTHKRVKGEWTGERVHRVERMDASDRKRR